MGKRLRKSVAIVLTGALLYTSLASPYAEAKAWKGRRGAAEAAASRKVPSDFSSSPVQLAQIPSSLLSLPAYNFAAPQPSSSEIFSASRVSVPAPQGILNLPQILRSVPASAAEIRKIHRSQNPAAPFIVLIQDAHEIESAQKNVARVLEALPTGILIGVEGSSGNYDLARYRALPDSESRRETWEFLLNKGFINGPEFFALSAPAEAKLWGVEDEALYLRNINAYRKGIDLKPQTDAELEKSEAELEARKKNLLSAEAFALDQLIARQERGEVRLPDFLAEVSKSGGIGAEFPDLRAYLKLAEKEKQIDLKAVEAARARFIAVLSRKASPASLQALAQWGLAYRLGQATDRQFYAQCLRSAEEAGVRLTDYPDFEKFIHYVFDADRIQPERLLAQLNDFKGAALRKLLRNPEEKALIEQSRAARALRKLTRQELSPEEWEAYRNATLERRRKAPEKALKRSDAAAQSQFSEAIAIYEDFYLASEERNTALIDNLLSKLNEGLRCDPSDESKNARTGKAAVLIAGGFHTPGLEKELAARGLSYAVLQPRMQVASGKGTDYLQAFAVTRTPVEKMLLGERLQANPPGMFTRPFATFSHISQIGIRTLRFAYVAIALSNGVDAELLERAALLKIQAVRRDADHTIAEIREGSGSAVRDFIAVVTRKQTAQPTPDLSAQTHEETLRAQLEDHSQTVSISGESSQSRVSILQSNSLLTQTFHARQKVLQTPIARLWERHWRGMLLFSAGIVLITGAAASLGGLELFILHSGKIFLLAVVTLFSLSPWFPKARGKLSAWASHWGSLSGPFFGTGLSLAPQAAQAGIGAMPRMAAIQDFIFSGGDTRTEDDDLPQYFKFVSVGEWQTAREMESVDLLRQGKTFPLHHDIVRHYPDPEVRLLARLLSALPEYDPKIEGEALLIGPDPQGVELLTLIETFPGITALHVVDRDAEVLRKLDASLARIKEDGKRIPPVTVYRANAIQLPRNLYGRIALAFDSRVFDAWPHFSKDQLNRALLSIHQTLMPGGVHFSRSNAFRGEEKVSFTKLSDLIAARWDHYPGVDREDGLAVINGANLWVRKVLPQPDLIARGFHYYEPVSAAEEDAVLKEVFENYRKGIAEYAGRFRTSLSSRPGRQRGRPIDAAPSGSLLSFPENKRTRHAGLYKDEQGVYWILKNPDVRDEFSMAAKNDVKSELLGFLLARGRANLTEIRRLAPEEAWHLPIERSGSDRYYLTRMVFAENVDPIEEHSRGEAFARLLVANIFMRKYDAHLANVAFADGTPVALDHDVIFTEKSSDPEFFPLFIHLLFLHWGTMTFEWLEGDRNPYMSIASRIDSIGMWGNLGMGPSRDLTRMKYVSDSYGIGAALIAAEELTEENLRAAILDFKSIHNSREIAELAGYEGEKLERISEEIERNRLHLGRDMSAVWQILTGRPDVFSDLDAVTPPRSPNEGIRVSALKIILALAVTLATLTHPFEAFAQNGETPAEIHSDSPPPAEVSPQTAVLAFPQQGTERKMTVEILGNFVRVRDVFVSINGNPLLHGVEDVYEIEPGKIEYYKNSRGNRYSQDTYEGEKYPESREKIIQLLESAINAVPAVDRDGPSGQAFRQVQQKIRNFGEVRKARPERFQPPDPLAWAATVIVSGLISLSSLLVIIALEFPTGYRKIKSRVRSAIAGPLGKWAQRTRRITDSTGLSAAQRAQTALAVFLPAIAIGMISTFFLNFDVFLLGQSFDLGIIICAATFMVYGAWVTEFIQAKRLNAAGVILMLAQSAFLRTALHRVASVGINRLKTVIPKPEDLVIDKPVKPGVWQAHDRRDVGKHPKNWFIKSKPSIPGEVAAYRIAARLGVNLPPWATVEASRIPGDIQREGTLVLVTADVNEMTYSDLAQKETSGIEEFFVFMMIANQGEFNPVKNMHMPTFNGVERYVPYDLEQLGIPIRNPLPRRAIEKSQMSAMRLISVIHEAEKMFDREWFLMAAIQSGFDEAKAELWADRWNERTRDLRNLVRDELQTYIPRSGVGNAFGFFYRKYVVIVSLQQFAHQLRDQIRAVHHGLRGAAFTTPGAALFAAGAIFGAPLILAAGAILLIAQGFALNGNGGGSRKPGDDFIAPDHAVRVDGVNYVYLRQGDEGKIYRSPDGKKVVKVFLDDYDRDQIELYLWVVGKLREMARGVVPEVEIPAGDIVAVEHPLRGGPAGIGIRNDFFEGERPAGQAQVGEVAAFLKAMERPIRERFGHFTTLEMDHNRSNFIRNGNRWINVDPVAIARVLENRDRLELARDREALNLEAVRTDPDLDFSELMPEFGKTELDQILSRLRENGEEALIREIEILWENGRQTHAILERLNWVAYKPMIVHSEGEWFVYYDGLGEGNVYRSFSGGRAVKIFRPEHSVKPGEIDRFVWLMNRIAEINPAQNLRIPRHRLAVVKAPYSLEENQVGVAREFVDGQPGGDEFLENESLSDDIGRLFGTVKAELFPGQDFQFDSKPGNFVLENRTGQWVAVDLVSIFESNQFADRIDRLRLAELAQFREALSRLRDARRITPSLYDQISRLDSVEEALNELHSNTNSPLILRANGEWFTYFDSHSERRVYRSLSGKRKISIYFDPEISRRNLELYLWLLGKLRAISSPSMEIPVGEIVEIVWGDSSDSVQFGILDNFYEQIGQPDEKALSQRSSITEILARYLTEDLGIELYLDTSRSNCIWSKDRFVFFDPIRMRPMLEHEDELEAMKLEDEHQTSLSHTPPAAPRAVKPTLRKTYDDDYDFVGREYYELTVKVEEEIIAKIIADNHIAPRPDGSYEVIIGVKGVYDSAIYSLTINQTYRCYVRQSLIGTPLSNALIQNQIENLQELNPYGKRPYYPRILMQGTVKKDGRDFSYVVTDALPGTELYELIRKGPLSEGVTIRFGVNLARRLQELHARNLLFIDWKTTNVLLEQDGAVRLVDFDRSARSGYDWEADPLKIQEIKNPYIEPVSPPDQQSDIYSAGLMIYSAATGVDLWVKGRESVDLQSIQNPGLRAVVERAAAPRGERYKSAKEMSDALEALAPPSAAMMWVYRIAKLFKPGLSPGDFSRDWASNPSEIVQGINALRAYPLLIQYEGVWYRHLKSGSEGRVYVDPDRTTVIKIYDKNLGPQKTDPDQTDLDNYAWLVNRLASTLNGALERITVLGVEAIKVHVPEHPWAARPALKMAYIPATHSDADDAVIKRMAVLDFGMMNNWLDRLLGQDRLYVDDIVKNLVWNGTRWVFIDAIKAKNIVDNRQRIIALREGKRHTDRAQASGQPSELAALNDPGLQKKTDSPQLILPDTRKSAERFYRFFRIRNPHELMIVWYAAFAELIHFLRIQYSLRPFERISDFADAHQPDWLNDWIPNAMHREGILSYLNGKDIRRELSQNRMQEYEDYRDAQKDSLFRYVQPKEPGPFLLLRVIENAANPIIQERMFRERALRTIWILSWAIDALALIVLTGWGLGGIDLNQFPVLSAVRIAMLAVILALVKPIFVHGFYGTLAYFKGWPQLVLGGGYADRHEDPLPVAKAYGESSRNDLALQEFVLRYRNFVLQQNRENARALVETAGRLNPELQAPFERLTGWVLNELSFNTQTLTDSLNAINALLMRQGLYVLSDILFPYSDELGYTSAVYRIDRANVYRENGSEALSLHLSPLADMNYDGHVGFMGITHGRIAIVMLPQQEDYVERTIFAALSGILNQTHPANLSDDVQEASRMLVEKDLDQILTPEEKAVVLSRWVPMIRERLRSDSSPVSRSKLRWALNSFRSDPIFAKLIRNVTASTELHELGHALGKLERGEDSAYAKELAGTALMGTSLVHLMVTLLESRSGPHADAGVVLFSQIASRLMSDRTRPFDRSDMGEFQILFATCLSLDPGVLRSALRETHDGLFRPFALDERRVRSAWRETEALEALRKFADDIRGEFYPFAEVLDEINRLGMAAEGRWLLLKPPSRSLSYALALRGADVTVATDRVDGPKLYQRPEMAEILSDRGGSVELLQGNVAQGVEDLLDENRREYYDNLAFSAMDREDLERRLRRSARWKAPEGGRWFITMLDEETEAAKEETALQIERILARSGRVVEVHRAPRYQPREGSLYVATVIKNPGAPIEETPYRGLPDWERPRSDFEVLQVKTWMTERELGEIHLTHRGEELNRLERGGQSPVSLESSRASDFLRELPGLLAGFTPARDFAGSEILMIGPNSSGAEVLALIELYPGIRAIHLLDRDIGVLSSIDRVLASYRASGRSLPPIVAHRASALEIPAQLVGRMALVYDCNVFDSAYFTDPQLAQAQRQIAAALEPGGIHYSAGRFLSYGHAGTQMRKLDPPGMNPSLHALWQKTGGLNDMRYSPEHPRNPRAKPPSSIYYHVSRAIKPWGQPGWIDTFSVLLEPFAILWLVLKAELPAQWGDRILGGLDMDSWSSLLAKPIGLSVLLVLFAVLHVALETVTAYRQGKVFPQSLSELWDWWVERFLSHVTRLGPYITVYAVTPARLPEVAKTTLMGMIIAASMGWHVFLDFRWQWWPQVLWPSHWFTKDQKETRRKNLLGDSADRGRFIENAERLWRQQDPLETEGEDPWLNWFVDDRWQKPEAFLWVRELLEEDPEPLVRRRAAAALGFVGEGAEAERAIVHALSDGNSMVRLAAERSLGLRRNPPKISSADGGANGGTPLATWGLWSLWSERVQKKEPQAARIESARTTGPQWESLISLFTFAAAFVLYFYSPSGLGFPFDDAMRLSLEPLARVLPEWKTPVSAFDIVVYAVEAILTAQFVFAAGHVIFGWLVLSGDGKTLERAWLWSARGPPFHRKLLAVLNDFLGRGLMLHLNLYLVAFVSVFALLGLEPYFSLPLFILLSGAESAIEGRGDFPWGHAARRHFLLNLPLLPADAQLQALPSSLTINRFNTRLTELGRKAQSQKREQDDLIQLDREIFAALRDAENAAEKARTSLSQNAREAADRRIAELRGPLEDLRTQIEAQLNRHRVEVLNLQAGEPYNATVMATRFLGSWRSMDIYHGDFAVLEMIEPGYLDLRGQNFNRPAKVRIARHDRLAAPIETAGPNAFRLRAIAAALTEWLPFYQAALSLLGDFFQRQRVGFLLEHDRAFLSRWARGAEHQEELRRFLERYSLEDYLKRARKGDISNVQDYLELRHPEGLADESLDAAKLNAPLRRIADADGAETPDAAALRDWLRRETALGWIAGAMLISFATALITPFAFDFLTGSLPMAEFLKFRSYGLGDFAATTAFALIMTAPMKFAAHLAYDLLAPRYGWPQLSLPDSDENVARLLRAVRAAGFADIDEARRAALSARGYPEAGEGVLEYFALDEKPELTQEDLYVRELVRRVRELDPEAVREAAEILASTLSSETPAILVPVPSSRGDLRINQALCDAIQAITGFPVVEALARAEATESVRFTYHAGRPAPLPQAHGLVVVQEIGEWVGPIYFIDDVVASGSTFKAAMEALGGRGRGLALAQGRDHRSAERIGALPADVQELLLHESLAEWLARAETSLAGEDSSNDVTAFSLGLPVLAALGGLLWAAAHLFPALPPAWAGIAAIGSLLFGSWAWAYHLKHRTLALFANLPAAREGRLNPFSSSAQRAPEGLALPPLRADFSAEFDPSAGMEARRAALAALEQTALSANLILGGGEWKAEAHPLAQERLTEASARLLSPAQLGAALAQWQTSPENFERRAAWAAEHLHVGGLAKDATLVLDAKGRENDLAYWRGAAALISSMIFGGESRDLRIAVLWENDDAALREAFKDLLAAESGSDSGLATDGSAKKAGRIVLVRESEEAEAGRMSEEKQVPLDAMIQHYFGAAATLKPVYVSTLEPMRFTASERLRQWLRFLTVTLNGLMFLSTQEELDQFLREEDLIETQA